MYDTRSYYQVNSLIQSINIQFFVYLYLYIINYYFLFCFVFSTMSIEIAENSEINYGKNIGLAWPGLASGLQVRPLWSLVNRHANRAQKETFQAPN